MELATAVHHSALFACVEAECATFTTLGRVAEWALHAMYRAIGATQEEEPRALAVMTLDEWTTLTSELTIVPDPDTPARKLTIIERMKLRLFFMGAGAASGVGLLVAVASSGAAPAEALQPAAPPPPEVAARTAKVSLILNQGSDEALPVLGADKIADFYSTYKRVYGLQPPPGQDCTAEQLSCIHHRLSVGVPPYADFSIFGPLVHDWPVASRCGASSCSTTASLPPWRCSATMFLRRRSSGSRPCRWGALLDYGAKIHEMAEEFGPAKRMCAAAHVARRAVAMGCGMASSRRRHAVLAEGV